MILGLILHGQSKKTTRSAQRHLLQRNYQGFLVEGQLALENHEPSIAAGRSFLR